MKGLKTNGLMVFVALLLALPALPASPTYAQGTCRTFPETGKRVGGLFLDYWERNGGLAQQGFPISDEFIEVSELDGKPYKVQYFQRAVFEYHPEKPPAFRVLLSQLGTFRYREKYGSGGGRPQPTPTRAVAQPTPTPAPPTPTPGPSCDTSATRNGSILPGPIVKPGDVVYFEAWGFRPNEEVSFWFTLPDGDVFGTAAPLCCAGGDGRVRFNPLAIPPEFAEFPGRWALTVQGAQSNNVAIIAFCVVRP